MWKIEYYTLANGYVDFKDISKEEALEIENAINFIKYYRVFEELFELFQLNFTDLSLFLVNTSERHRLNELHRYDDFTEPRLGSNQKLANMLSSFRTYIDLICHQLSSKYGKDSVIYQEFSEQTNILFDSYFSYRFFSKLRNYIQHYGMPISKISYNSSLDDSDNKSIYHSTNIYVNKKELLVYDGWGAILKKDFSKLGDEINIKSFLNEFFYTMILLYKKVKNLLDDEFKNSRNKLLSLHNECILHSGEPINRYDEFGLILFLKIEDKLENSGVIQFPIDMTRRVDRLYNKHNVNENNFLNSFTNTKY